MHELSIVMGIVSIAEKEAENAGAKEIERIELEIGTLAGIDLKALDFVWESAVMGTKLEDAERHIELIEGRAICSDCERDFKIENYYDPCPYCNSYLKIINSGKELRIKALEVS